jgi:hypothetical protein
VCLHFVAFGPPATRVSFSRLFIRPRHGVCVEGLLRLVRDLAENVCLQVFRKISSQIL